MKIKTTTTLKDLRGGEIKNGDDKLTVRDTLEIILVNSKVGGKHKLYNLALKVANQDVVEVDSADLNLIEDSVKNTEYYNALVVGQLLEILSSLKETDK